MLKLRDMVSGKRPMSFRTSSLIFSLFTLSFFTLIAACASLGNPDGGPFDETPPQVVRALPENQTVNSDKKKITIYFNEFIKIENASEKVVVSPPQEEMANVRADGKRIKIELFDTLRPNTTYTIDFSDAIVDNNEGNPMGNYTYSFSTGEDIDTMQVSGYVINAADLEPIKGILVGLYAVNEDSIVPDSVLRTRPFDRVSRTNGSGYFVIKGVARDRLYRAFALKDMDNDFRFSQKSELVAFDTLLFESTCKPDIRLDTMWRDSTHYDSIQPVHYTHFLPDEIVLRAFLEDGQDRHRLKEVREVPEKFTLFFTAPADTLPIIQGLSFEGDGGFIIEPSIGNDTITYWITDTTIAYCDSMIFELTYLDTDTLHQLVWKTDTVELPSKLTRARQLKDLQEEIDKWEKEYKKKQKRNKNLPPEENPFLVTHLTAECKPSGAVDPDQYPIITFSEPIDSIDSLAVRFLVKVDTTWEDSPFEFERVEGSPRQYQLFAEWNYGQSYQLTFDSAAVQGALGHSNEMLKMDFRVRKEEEYGALYIQMNPADSGIVVQLLTAGDKPLRAATTNAQGLAEFFFLRPMDYYLRCFVDSDGNGVWTTGEYDLGRAPEQVYYYPNPIPLKAKWEVNQDWNLNSVPAMKQKPVKLIKQKPDKEKKIRERNKEREAQMGKKKKS